MRVGLLKSGADAPAHHAELSAEELCRLVARLNDSGKVQTAFLSGKKAAELRPDNAENRYALGPLASA